MTIIKWTTIISKSKEIKNNVEKSHEIGLSSKWGYYFAKGILTPKKDIPKLNFEKAKNSNGTSNISLNISISNYKDMASRLVKYVEQNKQLPNNVKLVTKNSTYYFSGSYFTYFFATILVSLNENGKLPNPAQMNSKVFKKTTSIKKHGRSSQTGCDNRGQNTDYWCGPHMAQEIIRNLTGVVIPQSKIASIMGTTTSGTGHSGIDTFFAWFNKNYNYSLEWTWKNFSDLGWSGLKKILESNNQDAGEHELYRLTWGHYTNFDKIYENTVDVHNSLGSYCNNGCHCGYTENRTKSEARSYMNGISQKSILVVTRVK